MNPSYGIAVELRQLEGFVAVATELHFGRAAEKLHIGQPTLSELVRRLERELGTPLFTRTTRRVVLTSAGAELLTRSKVILEEVASASAAVRRIAGGDGGTVRLGITPPVASVLAPHLIAQFGLVAPNVTVAVQRLWLPMLVQAVREGDVDIALTCAIPEESEGVVSEVFGAEPLLVGLRPDHRFASRASIDLPSLGHDVLGATQESLFPAWALAQRQALQAARISPPFVTLDDTDLSATRWLEQQEPQWVMLTSSLITGTRDDVVLPVEPEGAVPYTLQWSPDRAANAAVARLVHCILSAALPSGWLTRAGHLGHDSGL
jgi:DNA-binding transcriptional LysR family regulator